MAKQQLQHFSHKHPLTLVVEEENVESSTSEYRPLNNRRRCHGCTEEIALGLPYYRCEEHCPLFCLHHSCAHLPTTIKRKDHFWGCDADLKLKKDLLKQSGELCYECQEPWCRFSYVCTFCSYVVDIRCAFKSTRNEAKHAFHQHPVYPRVFPWADLPCSACGSTVYEGFLCYRCNYCSFIVHPECTPLPVKLETPCHPHPLEMDMDYAGSKICQICCEEIDKSRHWAYYCPQCDDPDYYIHANGCSTTIRKEQLKHFSHIHPLALVEQEALDCTSDDHIVAQDCHGCRQKILSTPYYTCKHCKRYHLHKLCTDLPMEIQHQIHPGCTLQLLVNLPFIPGLHRRSCSGCRVECNGFAYHCSSCNFGLDIVCALKGIAWEKDFHQHPLVFSLTKSSFPCHACDGDGEGISYQCNTCQFWVHEQCASLPRVKETSFDKHNLNLIYSIPENFSDDVYCELCMKIIKHHNWAYHCNLCRHFTHVHDCSSPHRDGDKETIEANATLIYLPLPDEVIVENNVLNVTTIKKHRNPMILFADQFDSNAIDVTPSFINLVRGSPTWPTFHVDGTDYSGCTFSFYNGKLVMQITGVDLPHYIKHEAHTHVLQSSFLNTFTWCNACEHSFFGCGFRCTTCAFTIDTYCALLPGKIKHGYDAHPFQLTYSAIEGVEEYVCEICEEDVIPKWFYHCVDCDQSIHARCIWHAYIKFERIYYFGHHYCKLTLVPPSKDLPKCIICDAQETIDRGFGFLCKYCKFMVHLTCISEDELKVLRNGEVLCEDEDEVSQSDEELSKDDVEVSQNNEDLCEDEVEVPQNDEELSENEAEASQDEEEL